MRKKISSGSKFEKIVGYSRAVVDGEWIFVSGTTGYDYKNDTISDDVVVQTEQCISNIKSALSEANSSLEEIVRIRVYIKDNQYFLGEVGQILGKYFVAIVTGAGSGMGMAVAKLLAMNGAKVVLSDINKQSILLLEQELNDLGFDAKAIQGDVRNSKDVNNIIEQTVSIYKKINILINSAGILKPPRKIVEVDETEWDLVIDINLKGTFLCSKSVLPVMQLENWGRIINFSSTAGRSFSMVGGIHYTSSKTAILGFTRHLAKETAEYGITVNAVCPGLVDTEMIRSSMENEKIESYAESFPIQRLGTKEEVAELVNFLVSDKASYITGASFDINGGYLMI